MAPGTASVPMHALISQLGAVFFHRLHRGWSHMNYPFAHADLARPPGQSFLARYEISFLPPSEKEVSHGKRRRMLWLTRKAKRAISLSSRWASNPPIMPRLHMGCPLRRCCWLMWQRMHTTWICSACWWVPSDPPAQRVHALPLPDACALYTYLMCHPPLHAHGAPPASCRPAHAQEQASISASPPTHLPCLAPTTPTGSPGHVPAELQGTALPGALI